MLRSLILSALVLGSSAFSPSAPQGLSSSALRPQTSLRPSAPQLLSPSAPKRTQVSLFMANPRKEKKKAKKVAKQEQKQAQAQLQEKVDVILDELFETIDQPKRDLGVISKCVSGLRELRPELGKGEALEGDWKLAFVNTPTALEEVGTGLGKLPGTSILDMFISFEAGGKIKVSEVCRVVGPFPNIKNELLGSWKYQEGASGFGSGAEGLTLSYQSMVDGRNKVTDGDTGFKVRSVVTEVKYVDEDVLVLTVGSGNSEGQLIWEKESDLISELGRLLRQDLKSDGSEETRVFSPIEAVAELAKGEKKPWEFWK